VCVRAQHMAAPRDRLEFCAMLLLRGANPGMRDDGQRLAADFATQGSALEKLLRLPQGSQDAGKALHAALQVSHVALLRPYPQREGQRAVDERGVTRLTRLVSSRLTGVLHICQDAQSSRIKALKDLGNAAFQRQDYEGAMLSWRNALAMAPMADRAMEVTLLSNSSECELRLGQPAAAVTLVEMALALDPTHEKSLRRLQRAQTQVAEGERDVD
jgi:tetratricopeptide (TPR) repeat protein